MCATTTILLSRTVQKDRNPTHTLHKAETIKEIIKQGAITSVVMMLMGQMKTVMSRYRKWKHPPHISILNPIFLKDKSTVTYNYKGV